MSPKGVSSVNKTFIDTVREILSLQWAYHSPPYSWVLFHPIKHPNRIGVNWSLGSETHLDATLGTKANSFLEEAFGGDGTP